ncbi:MAG: HEPN domain-containing protein/predicted nucleotidyltransferase [Rickettsiales bacterium]|jgi:HEPN domain-containing protein/predicted nucleotidyltransferase
MKDSLPKKSQSHQEIILEIAQTIKEVGKKKISHIILFGSFARGNWINELKQESDGSWLKYISDYDFLVITKHHNLGTGINAINLEKKINEKIEKKLLDKDHHTSIIIEPLCRVNKELRKGQYFFTDIKKEGILLFQDDEVKDLSEPKELTAEEKKEIASEYFEDWFDKARGFLKVAKFCLQEKDYKLAAFNLHQTTENLYQCSHLVLTNYRPRIHDIEKLSKPLIFISKKFREIFPLTTTEEIECFDLLKRAYVESRYNKHYSITKEQLEYLILRVENLKKVVKEVCEDWIKELEEKK